MKEKTLLKIALITAMIGTCVLFFVSEKIEIDSATIDKITSEYLEKDIKISGYVTKIQELDKVAYVKIAQPKTMDVVVFKDGDLKIKENSYCEVTGMIEEYNGELQLIANEIKVK